MKTLAFIFAATMSSLTAFGTTFTGTIIETVTATTAPEYFVGQTVVGSYQYESPTVDGVFGTPLYQLYNPSVPATLQGSICLFLPFSLPTGNWLSLGLNDIGEGRTHLDVSGNKVTDFNLDFLTGPCDVFYSSSEFAIYDRLGILGSTFGTLCFGDPVAASDGSTTMADPISIPEGSTSTVTLVAFSLLGLILLRRFWK